MSRLHCIIALAVVLFTGCATAPAQRPIADLKLIAGAWRGSNNTGSPVDLIIYDGRYDAIITTPQQTLRRSGHIRLEGQHFSYDADSSSGQIAYFEGDGQRRLIMRGL